MHRESVKVRLPPISKVHSWLMGLTLFAIGMVEVPASELTLPLHLPVALLQSSLRDSLGIRNTGPTDIFHQGDCRYIQLDDLQLEISGETLALKTRTHLKFGPEWFGSCYGALEWQGQTRFELEPYITPEHLLRYRLLDTELLDEQGHKSLAADLVWKLIARIMRPRLEAFQIDLRPPRTEIATVLHNFVPQSQVEEIDTILGSARATTLKVTQGELSIPLIIEVPERYLVQGAAPPTPSVSPLSGEELAAFERTSQAWDAFLVYIIRNLGLGIEDSDIRIRLLEILLDSRYQIAAILAGEAEQSGGDPIRALFIRTWNDLHTLINDAAERGLLQGQLLPYLSFLSAGDALVLLDSTAPGLGIEISENGLRRLARAMRPADQSDPLNFDWNLDPFLQKLFDQEDQQEPTPSPSPPPTSWYRHWLDYLLPVAQADEDQPDPLRQLSDRLDRWIPKESELDVYRIFVAALLEAVRVREMAHTHLTTEESETFRHLVPATALIESCWRQFTRTKDGIRYVRSQSGSIGMMQINPGVWRGIFEIERLKTDTGYNVYAGSRILLRYLRLYARPIAQEHGSQDDLARATYAAYNAGPRAAGRFLASRPNARAKLVDDKFWNLYQAFSRGGNVDLQACTVTVPTS